MPAETGNITTESAKAIEAIKSWNFGSFSVEKLVKLVFLVVICMVAMKIIMLFLNKAITRLKIEPTLHTFIRSVVRILLWFLMILLLADFLTLPMTSLVALFSVIGLAVSLAIQGTLANLAGGIMILVSKPFKVGDYIEAGGVSGTVSDITLVYTRFKTFDNKLIFVPNGEISGEKIINYTTATERRVDLFFQLSYAAPLEQVQATILKVIHDHSRTLFTPAPVVRVNGYKESAVEYVARAWCATDDYWDVYYDLMEEIRAALDKAGIQMTYQHLNVHIIETKADGETGGTS